MLSDAVYIGLNVVECPNSSCTHYSAQAREQQKQEDDEDSCLYGNQFIFGMVKPP
jgi:hypothetical protein